MKSPLHTSLREQYRDRASLAETYVGPGGASLLPGGFGRTSLAVGPRVPMAVGGSGCWLTDEDGRNLIDLNNNFTSLIHGHARAEVTEAACAAMDAGASFGLPSMNEIEHARIMLTRVTRMDQIRYCNSGTEAVMLAIRLARAATGRNKVVMIRTAYHGTSEAALVAGGAHSRIGVPMAVQRHVIDLPINDTDALDACFARFGDRIAAVVLDPMPNRAGLVAATAEYLLSARHHCTETGALLVSDEVVAFRQAYGGAMDMAGVRPDLLVVGKIIGGGLPVGALLGDSDIMGWLDPVTGGGMEHGGTFSGNPVTMAAGAVALHLFTDSEIDRLNNLGAAMRSDLAEALDADGWEVRGAGSLLRLFPPAATPQDAKEAERRLWWEAYERGLLLMPNGLCALSTPMDVEITSLAVSRLVDAARATET